MKSIIERHKKTIIQIATPKGTGTGFYLRDSNIIVTNYHVLSETPEVIIFVEDDPKQQGKVFYIDPKYDLAFIKLEKVLSTESLSPSYRIKCNAGDRVLALGHPFGMDFTVTQGIVSNPNHFINDIAYIQHDASINPGNSGGPLIDGNGEILGVNTFIIQNGENIGFALPIAHVVQALEVLEAHKYQESSRCTSCVKIISLGERVGSFCPNCGAEILFPSDLEPYSTTGIQFKIEEILSDLGFDVFTARKGPSNWALNRGSASIIVRYSEEDKNIMCQSIIGKLPQDNIRAIYEYLLKQNYQDDLLTYSISKQHILLTVRIDEYQMDTKTAASMMKHLMKVADETDDILHKKFNTTKASD